jgi:uncharacterized membrane protein YfcA
MAKWLSRGIVFAALMVVVRLVQGALINQFETRALLISVSLVAVFAILAFVWGLIDGRADARANPDPDRRDDLAMTWLVAGLIAGLLSGAVSWAISLVYASVGNVGGLMNELTTFAAFTALLVFLPAVLGVAIGRWVTDRNADPTVRHSHAFDDEYARSDTDVFAAVRDDNPTGEIPVAAEGEAQSSRVALADRDPDTVVVNDDTVIEERRRD